MIDAPYWDDRPVILLGGGPSSQGFSCPVDAWVVALNWSVLRAPWDTAFTADPDIVMKPTFVSACQKGLRYGLEVILAPGSSTRVPGAIHCERRISGGLSDDPRVLFTAGSSGYAAINLAYLKRAREVYLLGYDYDRHPYSAWVAGYETMLPQLEAAGMKVVNCNPNSGLSFFPKVELDVVNLRLRR